MRSAVYNVTAVETATRLATCIRLGVMGVVRRNVTELRKWWSAGRSLMQSLLLQPDCWPARFVHVDWGSLGMHYNSAYYHDMAQ